MSFDKEKTVISINTEDKPKHSLCGAVGRFLLFIGATLTFIRNFIANAVMLLLIVFIVIAYNAATSFKEEAQAVFEGGKVQIPNEEVINSKILLLDLKGSISVGVIVHSDSYTSGHGPGVCVIATSKTGSIQPVVTKDANLKTYMKNLKRKG